MVVTGTVRYIDLGMGFWGIETPEGERWRPVTLPEAYRKEGRPIRATITPLPDAATAEMWGRVCEVVVSE